MVLYSQIQRWIRCATTRDRLLIDVAELLMYLLFLHFPTRTQTASRRTSASSTRRPATSLVSGAHSPNHKSHSCLVSELIFQALQLEHAYGLFKLLSFFHRPSFSFYLGHVGAY